MRTFKIERTRLVTETFRVIADSEDEAHQLLNESTGLLGSCGDDVEQLAESTIHSQIGFVEDEGDL